MVSFFHKNRSKNTHTEQYTPSWIPKMEKIFGGWRRFLRKDIASGRSVNIFSKHVVYESAVLFSPLPILRDTMPFSFKPLFRFEYQTLSAFFVIFIGTVSYHIIEWWRWLDSLYFSVITATTVGYGDLHPITDARKMFTIVYVIASVWVISSFIAEIAKRNRERTRKITKSVQG